MSETHAMPMMTDVREVRPIKEDSTRICEYCPATRLGRLAAFEVLARSNVREQAEHYQLREKTKYSCGFHLARAVRNNPLDGSEDEQAAAAWLLLRPDRFLSGEEVWAVVRASESHEPVYGYICLADERPDTIGKPRVSVAESETLRLAWERARCGEMDITKPYRIIGDQIETLGDDQGGTK